MPDINITENGVLKLLNKLDVSKAAGPDGIAHTERTVIRTYTYSYFTFQSLSPPAVPPRHLKTIQCDADLQEKRQDKPSQLSPCVLDVYLLLTSWAHHL